MHITLEADYAVRIVDCLAAQTTRLGASSIAEKTAVTPRFTLKILHKLVSSGIVRSYKGAKGGYELARAPEKITLREVIEVFEGAYTFSRCLDPQHICHCDTNACRKGSCRYQRAYDEISEMVRTKLEQMTFGS